jgi:membrane protein implicated in regulation of membrane protease activity
MIIAQMIVNLAGIYLLAGLLFALVFVIAGVGRLDPAAQGASVGFRLLIIPGVAAFWPLLAWRWRRGLTAPPREHNAHRDAARGGKR